MTTLTYLFRPSSKSKSSKGSIYMQFIHQRKVKIVTLSYKLYPHEWDAQNRFVAQIAPESERYHYLLQVIDNLQRNNLMFHKITASLEAQGRYTVDDVVRIFRNSDNMDHLLPFAELLSSKLRKSGQERTARAYLSAVRRLIKYNNNEDLKLNHINTCLIKDFERELKSTGKTLNTISFYMRNLRSIYNQAIQEKIIVRKNENPFASVFTGVQKTKKRALTMEDLQLLNKLDFSKKLENKMTVKDPTSNLYQAWRLFFFCFHARGMSFVDMAYLRKENIRGGIITYYRKKTGQLMEVSITPMLQKIIASFSDEMQSSHYVFPIIKDEKKDARLQYETGLRLQNFRLKKLSLLCGIKKNISTHVARHSWATVAKRENLPLWVISEGLGHSNEKTTYTYLASFDRSVLDSANEVISRAVSSLWDPSQSAFCRIS
ncbi:MAG: tyrosine-type recombinase/integrase [Dysgonomonas sp.]